MSAESVTIDMNKIVPLRLEEIIELCTISYEKGTSDVVNAITQTVEEGIPRDTFKQELSLVLMSRYTSQ